MHGLLHRFVFRQSTLETVPDRSPSSFFSLLVNAMRHNLLLSLLVLSLFTIGSLLVNWQLWQSLSSTYIRAASQSILNIDTTQEVAAQSHIGKVVLLKRDTVWCSSLYGNMPHLLSLGFPAASRLILCTGVLLTPDAPMMLLFTPSPGDGVAVSICGIHLQDALIIPANEAPLFMVASNCMLSAHGNALSASPSEGQTHQQNSTRYPFSSSYPAPAFSSLHRLLHHRLLPVILITLFSLAAGMLLRHIFTRLTSPETRLRNALRRGDIVPWCQPVVNGLTGDIQGFEVLARWWHPVTGFISPDIFIPLAEKTGLSDKVTHMLMQRVLEQLRSDIPDLPDGLHISFNISATHQDFAQLRQLCQAFLDTFGSKPVRLVLELTERESFTMTEGFQDMLTFIRENPVTLALDDFGTGYSGLASLAALPVSIIKIDKIFVDQITGTSATVPLLDCIIEMAERLSLKIIAEGVETQHQAHYLSRKGISFLQGYLFGRPVPLPLLVQRIKRETSWRFSLRQNLSREP